MRIRTTTGIALAGLTAAAVAALGGAAYAEDAGNLDGSTLVVTVDDDGRAGSAAPEGSGSAARNCPEKGGTSGWSPDAGPNGAAESL